jgi:virginiamycin A acetyltransferase
LKAAFKHVLHGVFLALAWPMALLTGFGRFESAFRFFAQWCALSPGLPGDYLRVAYYKLTLEACDLESRIEFGSFFAHPQARVAKLVYIGSYCVLGRASIGERTQIASAVQILSGRRQHARDRDGRILAGDLRTFDTVKIGADCWIGAGAIVMADVGAGSTVGAGSVVVRPIPPASVAVGSPARVVSGVAELGVE